MKAAAYIRVSTLEQAHEGYSLEAQRERIISYVKSQGWDLFDVYMDDGYSAKDLDRPAMKKMLTDIQNKKFDIVVVYKLDRLVRSVVDLHNLLKDFETHEVKFKSVSENFETTSAIGRLFITLVAALAQWEREQLAERVLMGMKQKAQKGERSNGSAPYGYETIDGRLVIIPEEAKIVKELFKMYANGKGLRECTFFMNQLQTAKKGNKSTHSIRYMLTNPVYAGHSQNGVRSDYNEYNIVENTHEAIIDHETFEKVQKIRQERSFKGKASTSDYIFSGIIRCERCGYPLSGFTNRGRKSYRCIGKTNYKVCDLPSFYEDTITSIFLDRLVPKGQFLPQIISEQLNFEHDDNSEIIEKLNHELASIKKRKKKWIQALGDELISDEEYKEMVAEDTKNEQKLRKQLVEYNQTTNTPDPNEVIEALVNIPFLWKNATDQEKKQFLNELFGKIFVNVPFRAKSGQRTQVEIKSVELRMD